MIRRDPIEDTPEYKAIEAAVEREVKAMLRDVPRGRGFCRRYWAAKREVLARHGIEWRSPAVMNPRVKFD